MQLVRRGRADADDWMRLADDTPLPDGADAVVSLDRWLARAPDLTNHDGRLGVAVDAETDIDVLGPSLHHACLVVLEFSSFADGRHYSNAMRLRSFYGFTGEIRAAGDVQRDQVFYLDRCGFDAYEIGDDVDISDFLSGLADFSGVYQYSADARVPAYRRRAGPDRVRARE